MKLLFNAVDSEATGCQRIIYPLTLLKESGIESEPYNKAQLDDQISRGFKHAFMQCLTSPQHLAIIKQLQSKGCGVIVDYDDDFSCLPENVLSRFPVSQEDLTHSWISILQAANVITAATPTLANIIRKYTCRSVHVIPNYLRQEDYLFSNAVHSDIKRKKSDTVRILFSGSESHLDDLKYILPVLKIVSKLYNVTFITHGGNSVFQLAPELKNVEHYDRVPYARYIQSLYEINPDIIVAPLLDTQHNRSRSNLKYLQAACVKALFICNDLPPYQDVDHGAAIKVSNRLGWLWQLRAAIKNLASVKYIRCINQAYSDVEDHIMEDHLQKWTGAFQAI